MRSDADIDYLLEPTAFDRRIAACEMSDDDRQRLADGEADMRRTIEGLLPVVLVGRGSDEEAEAATRLLLWLGNERRPRLLALAWWKGVHSRIWSIILARVWTDGKGGLSLRQAGFGTRDMAAMFDQADPQYLMSADEMAVYESLADPVVVYRGVAGIPASKARYGMSWTLDYERAAWFSTAHGRGDPLVIRAAAHKQNVLAYFGERSEAELVIKPGRVRNVSA